MQALIEKLKKEGGCLVSSGDCSEMEIADAQARGDFFVDDNNFGYVRRLPDWLNKHSRFARNADHDNCEAKPEPFDMVAQLQRQIDWSAKTFGPGARTLGVIDHIRKELDEIEADPMDLKEWVDVIILGFDGAWRAGWKPAGILQAMADKQENNENRAWPDWRTMSSDKAIEHDRSKDENPKDQQLKVEIIDNKLSISLGLNVLSHATEYGLSKVFGDDFKITDCDIFAAEIVRSLTVEDEDGTTPVHKMIDEAAIHAVEFGAEGVEYPDDV